MEPQQTGQSGRYQAPGQQPPTQPHPAQPGPIMQPHGEQRIISDFRSTPAPARMAPVGQQIAGAPVSPVNPARPVTPAPQPATAAPIATPVSPTAANPLASGAATAVAPTTSDQGNQEHVAPAHQPSFVKPAPPEIEPKEKPVEKSALRDLLSIAGVLVSALLLAFCLITFVFQSYQVDGPSMQTTLENNDHLIVWKVPKTFANLTGSHYIPNRGDVIIFNEPVSEGTVQNKQLIKRVMALPGERVTVKDGELKVYNQEHPEGFSPDKTLPYGKVITTTTGDVDVTVGKNQVFVCGDNRSNSLDSRIFGPIDSTQIVGKLVLRVLPLNTVKAF